MAELFNQIISHPFADITVLFALGGAIAFVLFLWGFSGYILAHEHDTHQNHANASMVWGAAWLVALFIIWETLRFIASFFYLTT